MTAGSGANARPITGIIRAPFPWLRPFSVETGHRGVSGAPLTPIACGFATVGHGTLRPSGALSRKTAKLMVLNLFETTAKS